MSEPFIEIRCVLAGVDSRSHDAAVRWECPLNLYLQHATENESAKQSGQFDVITAGWELQLPNSHTQQTTQRRTAPL
jgi:hypothetical protein